MGQMNEITGLKDLVDGGGYGQKGDQFEDGPLSELLNALGIDPLGSRDKQVRPRMRPQDALPMMQDTPQARPQARPHRPTYLPDINDPRENPQATVTAPQSQLSGVPENIMPRPGTGQFSLTPPQLSRVDEMKAMYTQMGMEAGEDPRWQDLVSDITEEERDAFQFWRRNQ